MARATQPTLRTLLTLALTGAASAGSLMGQGSLNPTVAPRAAELARNGQRGIGTEMLSRYLATSPDDGSAWIQLGRFYLLDIRDWHLSGHPADSPGPLYIDFGSAALDQAVRLLGDSGVILRQMLEVERAMDAVEQEGYGVLGQWTVPTDVAPLPDFISELGANLLSSCPASGVMATGNDLETVAIFSVVAAAGQAASVIIVVPASYATDARYRYRIASALGTDSSLVGPAGAGRCGAATAGLPDPARRSRATRLCLTCARCGSSRGDPGTTSSDRVVTVTDLARADRQGRSSWLREVHAVYTAAAGFNPRLCDGPLALLGDTQIAACRR